MHKPDLITVIVPAYNSEKTIIETLESVLIQTYENIELIVCSDYSTDNTDSIVTKWMQDKTIKSKLKNLKLICQPINVGLTKNLNTAIESSSGSWIKLIAADDILMPDCIETLYNECKRENSDIAFGNTVRFKTDNNGNQELLSDHKKNTTISKTFTLEKEDFFKELLKKCFLEAPAAIFSKKSWEDAGKFDEKYKLMEDWPFWLKCTELGKKFSYIDKDVVWYRIHSNSISTIKYLKIKGKTLNQINIDRINFDFNYRLNHIESILEKIDILNRYLASKVERSLPGGNYFYYIVRISNPLTIINAAKNIKFPV